MKETDLDEHNYENKDNVEQADFLDRVKNLSGDGGGVAEHLGTRLNFGIEEFQNDTNIGIKEDSIRSALSLTGDKKKRKGGGGGTLDKGYMGQVTKSVAGEKKVPASRYPLSQRNRGREKVAGKSVELADVGVTEDEENRPTSSSQNMGTKSTSSKSISNNSTGGPLGANTASTKLSLGSITSQAFKSDSSQVYQHLGQTSSTPSFGDFPSQNSKPTLGNLASQHLGQTSLKPTFGNLTSQQSDLTSSKPTLGNLASQHLVQTSSQPTLGNLASQHLVQTSSQPTLGNLASQHLGQTSSKPTLGNLASKHLGQTSSNPTLQGLASQHLGQTSSKPTLQGLASQHLSPTLSKPILGNLASQHLSQTSSTPFQHLGQSSSSSPDDVSPPYLVQPLSRLTLESKTQGQSQQNLSPSRSGFTIGKLVSGSQSTGSLSLLANQYLDRPSGGPGTNAGQQPPGGSQFTIPAIFGSPSSSSSSPSRMPVAPEGEIDLMSALKLGQSSDTDPEVDKDPTTEEEEVVMKTDIIVPDFSNIASGLRKRKSSSFSQVVARKWARIVPFKPIKINLNTIRFHQQSHCSPNEELQEPTFNFSTLSPDEVVLKAQSQSRAFVRQPIVSTRTS